MEESHLKHCELWKYESVSCSEEEAKFGVRAQYFLTFLRWCSCANRVQIDFLLFWGWELIWENGKACRLSGLCRGCLLRYFYLIGSGALYRLPMWMSFCEGLCSRAYECFTSARAANSQFVQNSLFSKARRMCCAELQHSLQLNQWECDFKVWLMHCASHCIQLEGGGTKSQIHFALSDGSVSNQRRNISREGMEWKIKIIWIGNCWNLFIFLFEFSSMIKK